jgi:hypothetical protein
MIFVSRKGQISTEYLLIMLAVVASLSFVVYEVSILYEKNITAIDNREFNELCDWLQSTVNLFELQPNARTEIEIKSLQAWTIEQNTTKSILLQNKSKECLIKSNYQIIPAETKIDGKATIALEKRIDKMYLDITIIED